MKAEMAREMADNKRDTKGLNFIFSKVNYASTKGKYSVKVSKPLISNSIKDTLLNYGYSLCETWHGDTKNIKITWQGK